MNTTEKAARYAGALARIRSLIQGETDKIAVMATIVAELHHSLDHFDWTGFCGLRYARGVR